MALFHHIGYVENKESGKPLEGAVIIPFVGGSAQTTYADESLTPKLTVTSNANGFYDFYIAYGEYDLSFIYGGVEIERVPDVDCGYAFTKVGPWLRPENELQPGESISVDAGPAIRRILAAGAPLMLTANKTYIVNFDPASALGPPGEYGYSILVPDNARIHGEAGSLIKQANGAASWCRTLSFANADNVVVTGVVKVDANVDNINPALNNEHMHAIFFFDSKNVYAESLIGVNARGDGVLIAGTDDTNGTTGYIGRVEASRCGRKPLVLQAFDIEIGTAYLDNSAGGAALYGGVADGTDGNCLDIEPDALTGAAQQNRLRMGRLFTKGAGNDITGGITKALRSKLQISIGEWNCVIVPRATTPWLTILGDEIEIGQFNVTGVTSVCPPAQIYYAPKVRIDSFTLNGAATAGATGALEIAAVGSDRPEVSIQSCDLQLTTGSGLYVNDAELRLGRLSGSVAQRALWARGTSSTAGIICDVTIAQIDLQNSGETAGANYGIFVSKTGSNQTRLNIGSASYRDDRATKLANLIYAGVGSSAGLSIGPADIDNATTKLFNGDGPEKYYKMAGSSVGVAGFVTLVDPEGSVPAPIGSLALWEGTGMRKKTSGTGNTGWAAL